MKNSYCVYKHTFPNGKIYIGISGSDLKKRWGKGSGYLKQPLVYNAIKKYGWDNIKHEILDCNLDKAIAENKEIEYIKVFNSANRNFGYNISIGGNSNGKQSRETKLKISQKLKGRQFSDATRKKLSESAKIKAFSEEHRKHIGDVNRGEKSKWYGTHLTQQQKDALSKRFDKKILCVETNVIYKNFLQIERELGIDRNCVSRCVKGLFKKAGNLHWKLLED